MDQQRRLLVFGLVSFLTFYGWLFIGPKFFPELFPDPQADVENVDGAAPVDGSASSEENARNTSGDDGDSGSSDSKTAAASNNDASDGDASNGDAEAAPKEPEAPKLPDFPTQTVVLGSPDVATGYVLQVELTSVGASVQSATLTDPRYPVAENPEKLDPRPQLRVVGNNLARDDSIKPLLKGRAALTVDLSMESVDEAFARQDIRASLRTLSWELLETEKDADNPDVISGATFGIVSPDGSLEVRKIFQLQRVPADRVSEPGIRQIFGPAYRLDVSIQLQNHSKKTIAAQYALQGPVGLPLEDVENARKYRDIKVGFLDEYGAVSAELLTASALAKDVKNESVEEWTKPVQYAGVDVQFFAALIVPTGDQIARQTFATVTPTVVTLDQESERSDISLELKSSELEIPADGLVQHDFQMFLGPKSQELLAPFKADTIIDYGWFGSISHVMTWLLKTFHGWGVHYGIAIIMLTILVRGMMFPISRKQAASSKKMKDLQPQLTAIRDKYKDDKQKLAQAQMELYREADFNPFAGCLPVFLQLPIFISLYQALNNWVDLRMASFLWIDNLAAPDALFEMGFSIPFLGSDFNLLPLITIVLFYAQQKMFMPPPTTDEMAMQQKMMNFMMIFMGFLFYRVPAGLCVYFIASSAWGMSERKLLEYLPEKKVDPEKLAKKKMKKGDGFFGKLMKQMQEAADMQEQIKKQNEARGGNNQSGEGSSKRRKK
ncbi:MAG: YidC/Oxa1 family insertase periplasmic-domain containing protein [Planctomycetota bacterium]|nr:YidC/Oxa1 family insertase periplasmic-domain containing protein [Planctomycetota bacterium]MDA0918358.1 YidC/Oxa1 family insertase periplasmic-domain containing protein [Planctomycetota bacterium]MDA1158089.1 YidC/Oxa1 family insertase periplasmic-domain containing protein [Planctomycetota bacterium]